MNLGMSCADFRGAGHLREPTTEMPTSPSDYIPVCIENLIRVDDVVKSLKLAA
jgi:hypothetical protein